MAYTEELINDLRTLANQLEQEEQDSAKRDIEWILDMINDTSYAAVRLDFLTHEENEDLAKSFDVSDPDIAKDIRENPTARLISTPLEFDIENDSIKVSETQGKDYDILEVMNDQIQEQVQKGADPKWLKLCAINWFKECIKTIENIDS